MSDETRGALFQIDGDTDEVRARASAVADRVAKMRDTVLQNKGELEALKDIGGLANCVDSLQNIANILQNVWDSLTQAHGQISTYLSAMDEASNVNVEF